MNISKILEQTKEEATDTQKVAAVAEMVASARKAYGNSDAEITAPYVPTTDGDVQLKYVDDATKLVLIGKEVRKIKAIAVQTAQESEGVNINKLVESFLATSPVLVNISDTTEFDYI